MSEKNEQRFQSSNKWWIYDKLLNVGDNKLRYCCHVTGKCRGSVHWTWNIKLKMTKIVPAIFHNLKGYDIRLIMQETVKLNVKVNVMPNELYKYMAFTNNKNFVFIDTCNFWILT